LYDGSLQEPMSEQALMGPKMMKRPASILVCTLALALTPALAIAQERLVDGAGGALAGVLVGGPIGAVAGGVIGYAAGPNIARGMGLKGHRRYHRVHHVTNQR
jgi:hypothetical protein